VLFAWTNRDAYLSLLSHQLHKVIAIAMTKAAPRTRKRP
jgi:hypothetical protein